MLIAANYFWNRFSVSQIFGEHRKFNTDFEDIYGNVINHETTQASQLFERAVSGVMKKCALLYFTYADFEEQNMKFEKVPAQNQTLEIYSGLKVHKIYMDFLAVESIDPTLAYVQYMKFCRRAEGIKV